MLYIQCHYMIYMVGAKPGGSWNNILMVYNYASCFKPYIMMLTWLSQNLLVNHPIKLNTYSVNRMQV